MQLVFQITNELTNKTELNHYILINIRNEYIINILSRFLNIYQRNFAINNINPEDLFFISFS